MTVILPGSIRSKKNSKRVFKRGPVVKVLPSAAYLKWEDEARVSVMQQLFPECAKLDGDLHVKVTAYYKGQQPDLSGVLESVGDCLEGFLWDNDRQIKSWDGSRLFHDKYNPRTIVEIVTLSENNVLPTVTTGASQLALRNGDCQPSACQGEQ